MICLAAKFILNARSDTGVFSARKRGARTGRNPRSLRRSFDPRTAPGLGMRIVRAFSQQLNAAIAVRRCGEPCRLQDSFVGLMNLIADGARALRPARRQRQSALERRRTSDFRDPCRRGGRAAQRCCPCLLCP
jgi:hypothetical protein